ncbi:MAG: hypothetical protein ACKVLL_17335, partial [Verrucomicrobiales bacterium]
KAIIAYDVSVVCPEENGHLSQTETEDDLGQTVPGAHAFNLNGATFTISVFASVFGVSDPDEHTLKSKTVASCKVMRNDVVVLSTEDETVTSTFNSYEK